MAVRLHARDLADILAGGEATSQDEVRAAEKVLAFASDTMRRYMGTDLSEVPDSICDNVVLRLAGWLREAPSSSARAVQNSRGAGIAPNQRAVEYAFEFSVNHDHATASPLRSSGAMSLLSPFKRRRALG